MKILYLFFLIGLLIHFFVYNFIVFGLGIDNISFIFLWKEIFIVIFGIIGIYLIFKNNIVKYFKNVNPIFVLQLIFIIMIILAFVVNIINGISIKQFFIGFKYDFIGFLIFFIFYNIGFLSKKLEFGQLIKYYILLIKICLIVALVWYMIILVKPGTLKYFGYDRNIFEGSLGDKPPAVYYTKINHGYVRNQFLFERPIYYGFFLIAFFPLFYGSVLRRKSLGKSFFWRGIYVINIILTFSRAAIIGFLIELLIIGFLDYGYKNLKNFAYKIVLPCIFIILLLGIFGYKHLITREFSNTGHIQLLKEGVIIFLENPLFGNGAGSAGPGSHFICQENSNFQNMQNYCEKIKQINISHQNFDLKGFNTENQFLQILVEYGAIVGLIWIGIFIFLCWYGIGLYIFTRKNKVNQFNLFIILCFSIGMIGLAIEGVFLHSFIDRMIVYPYMMLFGLAVGEHLKNNS